MSDKDVCADTPGFYYTPRLRQIVDTLVRVTNLSAFLGVVKGAPGSGKTALLDQLNASLSAQGWLKVVRLSSDAPLLPTLAAGFGLTDGDQRDLRRALIQHLISLHVAGTHPVVLVDDAHRYDDQDLALLLRLALSADRGKSGLLSAVIAGIPDIEHRLTAVSANLSPQRLYVIDLPAFDSEQRIDFLLHCGYIREDIEHPATLRRLMHCDGTPGALLESMHLRSTAHSATRRITAIAAIVLLAAGGSYFLLSRDQEQPSTARPSTTTAPAIAQSSPPALPLESQQAPAMTEKTPTLNAPTTPEDAEQSPEEQSQPAAQTTPEAAATAAGEQGQEVTQQEADGSHQSTEPQPAPQQPDTTAVVTGDVTAPTLQKPDSTPVQETQAAAPSVQDTSAQPLLPQSADTPEAVTQAPATEEPTQNANTSDHDTTPIPTPPAATAEATQTGTTSAVAPPQPASISPTPNDTMPAPEAAMLPDTSPASAAPKADSTQDNSDTPPSTPPAAGNTSATASTASPEVKPSGEVPPPGAPLPNASASAASPAKSETSNVQAGDDETEPFEQVYPLPLVKLSPPPEDKTPPAKKPARPAKPVAQPATMQPPSPPHNEHQTRSSTTPTETAPAHPTPPLPAKTTATNTPTSANTLPDWLSEAAANAWVVQIAATENSTRLLTFAQSQQLSGAHLAPIIRNGKSWYALVTGPYSDMKSAQAALAALPPGLRSAGPWVRSVKSLRAAGEKRKAP